MNPEVEVKKHCQILLGVIAVLFLFGDSFILDDKIKKIRSLKGQIRKKQNEKSNYDTLKAAKESLQREMENYKDGWERLFEKFPAGESTENNMMNILANVTSKVIVIKEKRKPKYTKVWQTDGIPVYEVPKVTDNDAAMELGNQVSVANFETNMEIRCNYFELLGFFHDLSNANIYLSPMDVDITMDKDMPYGVTAKIRLLTFGFEGFVVDKRGF